MSLFRSPSVRTRKQLQMEAYADLELKASIEQEKCTKSEKIMANKSKSEGSQPSCVSSTAAKKRLEYETAEKKAKIQLEAAEAAAEIAKQKAQIEMELLDKKMAADMAEIEGRSQKISSSSSSSSKNRVEEWLNKSQVCNSPVVEQDVRGAISHAEHDRSDYHQAPQRSDIDRLADALKKAISTSAPKIQSQELLTRLATSKDLPLYFGDPMEWLQFKEAYYESTRLCRYSDTENLWRLRKCLRGDAKDAVSSLLIGGTEPDIVIQTLELRFGRPENIMSKIVSQLKKLNPLPLAYHNEIVNFSFKIKNYAAAANAINQVDYLRSPELVSIVLSKLPATLITKWSDFAYEQSSRDVPKLLCLADFLYLEATKVASSGVSYIQSQSDVKRKSEYHAVKGQQQHTILHYSDAEDQSRHKCLFCRGQAHALKDCAKFKRALRKDRWRFVRIRQLCYKCLGTRHNDSSACTAPNCDIEGCGHPHHRLLHWTKPKPRTTEDAETKPEDQVSDTIAHTVALQSPTSVPKIMLKVVPVTIFGPKGSNQVYALLDDGATVSLIASDVAESVGLHGESLTMRVRCAWDSAELACKTEIVKFVIANSAGDRYYLRARKMNELNLPVQRLSAIDRSDDESLPYNYYHMSKCNVQPKLLIGQDNYDLIAPIKCIKGNIGEPYVTKTSLGWCAHGIVSKVRDNLSTDCFVTHLNASNCVPLLHNECKRTECSGPAELLTPATTPAPTTPDYHKLKSRTKWGSTNPPHASLIDHGTLDNNNCDCSHKIDLQLDEFVRRSFSLDSIGITNKPRRNLDELRAIEILNNTAELVNGQWTVGLPWKHDNFSMPNSYPNALNRLKSVQRKMALNETYAIRYQDRIQHLLTNDYAREIPTGAPGNHVWYLPHFGVDNPNKKKLRLVFDAAANSYGYSLNDFILQGPDLLQSLYGIMFRFRENPVGIIGDIKDMFLRIKIRSEDQDALRFLWNDKEYAMTSLIFGANCSPFVAQFINQNKNASRFQEQFPAAVFAIQRSQYMDDFIDSLDCKSSAIKMIQDVSYINQQGGFEMCNWMSNEPTVLDCISKGKLSDNAIKFQIDCQPERTLGLLWYPSSDMFAFDLSLKRIPDDILKLERKPTKREMLRIIMSIFDIHGFLGPFTIKAKILMQETWRTKVQWDQHISGNLFATFRDWITQLQTINNIRIPRWYFRPSKQVISSDDDGDCTVNATGGSETALELHVFSDASPCAYAAVAYWRQCVNGKIHVSFIASKSRVAPTKLVTIPRLELQGAVLACRLADSIKKEHRIEPTTTYYWVDSMTVLHWIRNEHRNFKSFIAHRLGDIDESTRVQEWHYVPSEWNVADLATKNTDHQLTNSSEWFLGPSFLLDDSKRWPREPEIKNKISDEVLEKIHAVYECDALNLPTPDPSRFSSWLRLLRTTARVLLFIDKCKKRNTKFDDELMIRAETLLLRQSQAQSFQDEITLLDQNKAIKRDSRLRTLTPILDSNQILRVGGRIGAAKDVPLSTKSPVILDGRSQTARLLVNDYHIRANHACNELVINELRQKYWLLSMRPTVRNVASKCYVCRIRKAAPSPPRLGDLPEARLTHHQRAFTVCGVDLFGPMEVAVGRQRHKRYGVLFTCLTVRAVHIEIVPALSADSLIMALRRMSARRGWPRVIYSDNGTNMRGAATELNKAYEEIDRQRLTSDALNKGVDWRFIPPASPHMGGAWERLIRSVKEALKVVLKERVPREETLSTLLAEVENMINCRPLTHVSVDPRSDESLTPNHFLIGSSSNLPLPGYFDEGDLYLRKQWRIAQRLADLFWARWMKEVLPTLLPRGKWFTEGTQLKVNDLVVIVDPKSPRNHWPKGKVQAVYPGADGRVRVVDVKTISGVTKRPVTRVALLFSDECHNPDTRGEDVDDGSPTLPNISEK